MPLSRRQLLLGSTGLALAGCSGSDAGFDPSLIARIPPTLTLHWAARRRATEAPSTANFAEIVVRSVASPTEVATLTVRRESTGRDNTEAFSQTLTLPTALPLGAVDVVVRFYDEAAAPGSEQRRSLVAQAQARVELARPEGILPAIAVTGRVAHVEVRAAQTVTLGQRRELEVVATDTDGNLLALSPGALFFEIVEGEGTILSYEAAPTANALGDPPVGSFKGLALGTAKVRVRVADFVSAPVIVTVVLFLPLVTGGRVAYLDADALSWDAGRQSLWFLDGATHTRLQRLDPASGVLQGQAIPLGSPTFQLALSPEGTLAYGYSTGGGGTIRRVSLTNARELDGISLASTPTPLPRVPFAPLSGDRVLVAGAPLGGTQDVVLYAGTTPLPSTLKTLLSAAGMDTQATTTGLSVSDDGTLAYLEFPGSRGNIVISETWRVRLGADGLVMGSLEPFPAGRFYRGQLITGQGDIFDASTAVKRFVFSTLPVVPSGISSTYIVPGGAPHTLAVVSQADFTTRGVLTVPTELPSYPNFDSPVAVRSFGVSTGWGTSGLAVQAITESGRGCVLLFEGVAGL